MVNGPPYAARLLAKTADGQRPEVPIGGSIHIVSAVPVPTGNRGRLE